MNLNYWSQLDMKFGFIRVAVILIGGFAATFGYGFEVNVSNGQEIDTQ